MKEIIGLIVIPLIILGGFWYLNPKIFYESVVGVLITIPISSGLMWVIRKIF
jgi:hypothetical protein